MRKIGMVVDGAEGGALGFITACREGQKLLGAHTYPEIIVSAIPLGPNLPAWEAGDYAALAKDYRRGVELVAAAGADFFICPNNTAHIVLEQIADTLPIPGLHIADVVCHQIARSGWRSAGLLGTNWTMSGPVYAAALRKHGIERIVPGEQHRTEINRLIFDDLCQAKFLPGTTDLFVQVIEDLRRAGADCVILGCTEIPLIISNENSALPVLDSTRLLAQQAVKLAVEDAIPLPARGWISIEMQERTHEPTPVSSR